MYVEGRFIVSDNVSELSRQVVALIDEQAKLFFDKEYGQIGVLDKCNFYFVIDRDMGAKLDFDGCQVSLMLKFGYPDTFMEPISMQWCVKSSNDLTTWIPFADGSMFKCTLPNQRRVQMYMDYFSSRMKVRGMYFLPDVYVDLHFYEYVSEDDAIALSKILDSISKKHGIFAALLNSDNRIITLHFDTYEVVLDMDKVISNLMKRKYLKGKIEYAHFRA